MAETYDPQPISLEDAKRIWSFNLLEEAKSIWQMWTSHGIWCAQIRNVSGTSCF